MGEPHRPGGIVQVASYVVGRRLRDRDAGQRQQQGHVRPREAQLKIGAGEGQRVLDGAHQRHLGGAVLDLQVHRIGRGVIAQRQQRAAGEAGEDGLLGISALGAGDDLAGLAGLVAIGILSGDIDVEIGAQLRRDDVGVPVVDLQVADFGAGCGGGSVAVRVARERPVVRAVRKLLRVHLRMIDRDVRDDDLPAMDVSHRIDIHAELIGGGQVAAALPVLGIADGDAVGLYVRHPAQADVQVGDGDRPAQCGGGLLLHGRDQPVPLEQRNDGHQQGGDAAQHPRPPPPLLCF